MRKSFCAPCTKLATRNQLVFLSSPLPNELPITYLTSVRSPEMVTSSGATPRRPTTVMRASCDAGEELKLRVKARGAAVRKVLANILRFVRMLWLGVVAAVMMIVVVFGVAVGTVEGRDSRRRGRVDAAVRGRRREVSHRGHWQTSVLKRRDGCGGTNLWIGIV